MEPRTPIMPVCQTDKKILTISWLWAYDKKKYHVQSTTKPHSMSLTTQI